MANAHIRTASPPSTTVTLTVGNADAMIFANAMAANINTLLGGGDTITTLSPSTVAGAAHPPAGKTPIYNLAGSTVSAAPQYSIPASGYVLDTIGGAATINGTAKAGDSVYVGGAGGQTSFIANGGSNLVIFDNGNNTYAAAKGDTGGDTVLAGTGFDTITTGLGATTVYAGTGTASISLNDTVKGSGFNDRAYLDYGHSTVMAGGSTDAVIATAAGQTITGGAHAGLVTAVLAIAGGGAIAGNDLVSGGGASVAAVYDSNSNNTINAGSGITYLVAGASVAAAVNNGAGTAYLFGNNGTDFSVGTAAGEAGGVVFVASAGNETLNGSGASSNLYMFGGNDSATGADVLTGGGGNDLLVGGRGSETLTGGAGTNTFLFGDQGTAGATITIADFTASAANRIVLSGFSQNDLQNLVSGGTEVNGDYTVTLSNKAVLIFDGVADGSVLNGHLAGF